MMFSPNVMVKNGIHKFLFDQNAKCHELFQDKMKDAEWVAAGRQKSGAFVLHSYPGLAGGRLMRSGNVKFAKLDKEITEELMVSFKAIVGAMVLAIGAKKMWNVIAPLFDELLSLSPAALRRHYSNESSVVSSYSKTHQCGATEK
jgi:hypothetical protein